MSVERSSIFNVVTKTATQTILALDIYEHSDSVTIHSHVSDKQVRFNVKHLRDVIEALSSLRVDLALRGKLDDRDVAK